MQKRTTRLIVQVGYFSLFLAIQISITVYLFILLHNVKKTSRKIQKKNLFLIQRNEKLIHTAYLAIESFTGFRSLPPSLSKTPFADQAKIVLDVKRVSFSSPSKPYNASIGFVGGKCHLFFRYDTSIYRGENLLVSNIGYIQLDQDLNPLEQTLCSIQTGSPFSEDPRFFQHNGDNYLIYSDLDPHYKVRGIRIGALNLAEQRLEYITSLNLKTRKTEKNWTPFSYGREIHFVHAIDEHRILSLSGPKEGHLRINPDSIPMSFNWAKHWGRLRGGTPALLVDGEYVSFFHSSFEDDKGIIWYVMGAYTFAPTRPFQVKRVSPYPILFQGIYDTPHQPIANPRVRALYPAGLALQYRDGKDVLLVSCGENDSGVKLIAIDKAALFASLIDRSNAKI